MNFNFLNHAVLFLAATTPIGITNEFVQYGFLGILLSILIWNYRWNFKENVRRDKMQETERKELIIRYEAEKKEIISRYETELSNERNRYHDMHKEVMSYLNNHK